MMDELLLRLLCENKAFSGSARRLDIAPSAAVVGFNLNSNTLAKATLMGLFKR
jgi:hypothetical protein